METPAGVSASRSPFETLRARGLLAQTFAGALVALVAARAVSSRFGGGGGLGAGDPAAFALFYAGVGFVLAVRMRTDGLDASRLFGPVPTRETLRLTTVAVPLAVLSVAGFWILFLPLSYAAPDFVQRRAFDNSALSAPTSLSSWTAHLCVAAILAPVIEEILFRGLLLQRWALRWGTPAGVLLSSGLFAIGHVEILGHFLFGLAMAALYLRTRSLWVPIAAHALNNFLASVFTLPAVISPEAPGSAMTVASFQSEWWVGPLMLAVGLGLLDLYRRALWPGVDFRRLFREAVPYARDPAPAVS